MLHYIYSGHTYVDAQYVVSELIIKLQEVRDAKGRKTKWKYS